MSKLILTLRLGQCDTVGDGLQQTRCLFTNVHEFRPASKAFLAHLLRIEHQVAAGGPVQKKLSSERQIMVCVTSEETDTFLHTDCRTKRAETKTNKGCSSHMGRYLYKYQFWVPCGHWPDLWGGEEADHVVESACSYQRPWGGVKYWFRICLQ